MKNKIYFPVRDRDFTVFLFQLLNLHPIIYNVYITSSGSQGNKAYLPSRKTVPVVVSTLTLLEQEKITAVRQLKNLLLNHLSAINCGRE